MSVLPSLSTCEILFLTAPIECAFMLSQSLIQFGKIWSLKGRREQRANPRSNCTSWKDSASMTCSAAENKQSYGKGNVGYRAESL